MADNEKPAAPPPGLPASAQDWVAQLRQISVPVWARALALTLSLAVLLPGLALIWGGWLGCSGFVNNWFGSDIACHEKWVAQGVEIVATALVPVVAILYLVFAETGMRSLARRTDDLLDKLVPQALTANAGATSIYADGMDMCSVETSPRALGNISACYTLQYRHDGEAGTLRLTVHVNVAKAVIVFFLPVATGTDPANADKLLSPTMKGARHEGYVFDDGLLPSRREGRDYLLLVARRNLPADFLWNPGAKLHFAWDLRAFAYSVIHDGHSLLRS